MKLTRSIAMAITASCVLAGTHCAKGVIYRSYLSAAQPVEMKGGVVSHEQYLTLNFKKPDITRPGRPLLEAEGGRPMFDNFIKGLEPKNPGPIDPKEEQWATYALDTPVPAGEFIAFLNVWNFRHATNSTTRFSVCANGKTVSYDFPFIEGPYKGAKYRWIPFEFNTVKPVDRFTVKIAPPPDAPFIIRGIFVSNQKSDMEYAGASSIPVLAMSDPSPFDEGEKTSEDVRTPASPNMVLGSDFETGPGFGWRSMTKNFLYNERTYGDSPGYESPHSACPVGAMGLFSSMILVSDSILVREPGKYVFSFYARTVGTNSTLLSQVRTDKKLYLSSGISFKDDLTKEWKRYSHEVDLEKGKVAVAFTLPEDIEVDRIQFEKNFLTDYQQALDLELGSFFGGDRYTHAYRTNEKIPVRLMACARDKTRKTAEFKAWIVDYYGKTVWEKDFTVPLKNGIGSVEIDIQNKCPGIYRLLMGPSDQNDYIAEKVFTNHFPPEPWHANTPSSVGFYAALGHSSLQTLDISGMNHAITFSCFPKTGHWNRVGKGPTAKDVVFYDEYVNLCDKYDIEVTVNVDYRPPPMRWLKIREGSKIMPADMNDWRVFLETLMGHYGNKVNAWLILDDLSHFMPPPEYKEFTDIAREVHDKVVPDSKLILWIYNTPSSYFDMGLTPEDEKKYGEYFSAKTDVLFMANRSWCEKFVGKKEIRRYFHGGAGSGIYAKNSAKTTFAFGVPFDPLVYKSSAPTCTKRAINEFSEYMIDRFQYYSARTPPDRKSIYHYDGTLTPAGHAFSVLNHFMRGKRMYMKHMAPGLEINEFRDPDGRSFITMWSRRGDPIEVTIPVKPSEIQVFDLVGKPQKPVATAGGTTLLVSSDILYVQPTDKLDFETVLKNAQLNNIAPVKMYLAATDDDRHLDLMFQVANRTDKPQELVVNFQPRGINWSTGTGDFHNDLTAPLKNYEKTLKPGQTDLVSCPVRYIPGQEYLSRAIGLAMKWMGEKTRVSYPVKLAYASRIPDKKAPDAAIAELLKPDRFNRIAGIDISVRHPAARNEVDVMCYPRWDAKNIYFTTRTLSKGFALGNPENIVRVFLDPEPMLNHNRSDDKKTSLTILGDLNKGTATLLKHDKSVELPCKMIKTPEELSIEWAVPWSEIGVDPPASGKLDVIGMNYSYLTASAAETYYYPWMEWTDRKGLVPDSIGYLVLGE